MSTPRVCRFQTPRYKCLYVTGTCKTIKEHRLKIYYTLLSSPASFSRWLTVYFYRLPVLQWRFYTTWRSWVVFQCEFYRQWYIYGAGWSTFTKVSNAHRTKLVFCLSLSLYWCDILLGVILRLGVVFISKYIQPQFLYGQSNIHGARFKALL